MGMAEDLLNYPMSERTRFRVRVELNEDLSGTPRIEWVRNCRSLEEAQRGYVALRDGSGYGASQFGSGAVFDEAGQLIANISYNGRLWAPSPDGAGWRPGAVPIAEAPSTEITMRGLLSRLAGFSGSDLGTEGSAQALKALASAAEGLLRDPRTGLTQEQSDPNAIGVRVWAAGPGAGIFTQGPSPELSFLDALAEGDIVQGFNAQGDVLTEGMKTDQGIAWRRVHHGELERARSVVADVLFETVDLDELEVVGSSGWETEGDIWRRVVFIHDEEPDAPSLRGALVVQFHPASDEAASLSLDGQELLVPEHDPDYPMISPENGSDRTPGL